jgi:hypothetical protein
MLRVKHILYCIGGPRYHSKKRKKIQLSFGKCPYIWINLSVVRVIFLLTPRAVFPNKIGWEIFH